MSHNLQSKIYIMPHLFLTLFYNYHNIRQNMILFTTGHGVRLWFRSSQIGRKEILVLKDEDIMQIVEFGMHDLGRRTTILGPSEKYVWVR